MRILLDYRPALRERTGVGQWVHGLAAALQQQLGSGESLTLFSSSWKDRLPAGVAPGTRRIDARVPVRVLNFAWHRLEWPPVERFAGAVDIAHSAHPLLMPARQAAQVVTVHDLDFMDHPERTRAEIRRDYRALVGRHVRRARLVVVNSTYTAGSVQRRLGVDAHRLVVCRPGAPPLPARAPAAANGPILFVGTIEPRKNLSTLLAAYARLTASPGDHPPLVLAGRRVEQSDAILRSIDRTPELRGRVRHVGYVSDAERLRLYSAASMLVLPSLDEGFGLPALEAMQVGLPVIASDRGALPEVVGDAGVLVDPSREEDLAHAMHLLLTDEAQRLRCTEAGRARAREFSWEASARSLLDAYRRLLSAVARERL